MSFFDQEALEERADQLAGLGLNGLDFVLVTLPASSPPEAHLELHFHSDSRVADILASAMDPRSIFPITGGHRVRAGAGTGEVQVHQILAGGAGHVLRLVVRPIGDYSTYTLSVQFADMDPMFSDIDFKFRPGCFSLCAPDWPAPPPPSDEPIIDYLAKDYDSFRHVLMTAMQQRVPGWEPTSETDLSQVLISLFSAAADELSDYQDRVASEAYLASARNRVSLARHGRLMDYHLHQGSQAETWLAVTVTSSAVIDLPVGFECWAGRDEQDEDAEVFLSRTRRPMHHLVNAMRLYTWSGTRPGLAAGATSADLELAVAGQPAADEVRDLIRDGTVTDLLIQEHLNPLTLRQPGRDPGKRQLLRLLPNSAASNRDPVTGGWYVHLEWRNEDRLRSDYCFSVLTEDGLASDEVSLFHGNLVTVHHGRGRAVVFKEAGDLLTGPGERHLERTERWGALCRLPAEDRLLYRQTVPRSEEVPLTTLDLPLEERGADPRVSVIPSGGVPQPWEEAISLVNCADGDDCFTVETDEQGRSVVRFGDGINGRRLPAGAEVHCWYQIGSALDGNVGADRLVRFDGAGHPAVSEVWNPFDVTNGVAPELREEAIRNIPEAYRTRQLRAVTLGDYVRRAEELPGVSRASARYAWTGSWRTVQIAIDPKETDVLAPALRLDIARHLEAVRLIGEDLEVRPPRFVPLDIEVRLCVDAEVWPEDVRTFLEQEFSDGFTTDGRMGFFHPDRWTFGQFLYASEIFGRLHQVAGVDHAISVSMRRFDAVTPGTGDVIEVTANEIIQVRNDPDHKELGMIRFDLQGGRQ